MVRVGGRYTVYPRVAAELVRRRRQFDAIVDIQNGVPFWSPLYSGKRVVCVVRNVYKRFYFGQCGHGKTFIPVIVV